MKETIALIESFFADRNSWEKYVDHPDWHVRYGLAVAIGELGTKEDIPLLEKILKMEEGRSLFNQPGAHFSNCTDDTRLSEYIGLLTMHFDREYPEEVMQAWQCRGRIYQAVFFAVYKIGYFPESWKEKTLEFMKTCSDYAVVASMCIALRRTNDKSIIPALKEIEGTDFCSSFELTKTIRILSEA